MKAELHWIDVKEEMPKIGKLGDSETVLVSIHDMDVPPDDAEEWEKTFYTPFYVNRAHLVALSTGCRVWVDSQSGTPVEDLMNVVTHWAHYPEPVEVE